MGSTLTHDREILVSIILIYDCYFVRFFFGSIVKKTNKIKLKRTKLHINRTIETKVKLSLK